MRRLDDALAAHPWAQHVGPVPHAAMPALLAAADIVLNCSSSEGGMANAVIEALAVGRAVLAADIPGQPVADRGRRHRPPVRLRRAS